MCDQVGFALKVELLLLDLGEKKRGMRKKKEKKEKERKEGRKEEEGGEAKERTAHADTQRLQQTGLPPQAEPPHWSLRP